jgi:type IV pilus assembly protein PilA
MPTCPRCGTANQDNTRFCSMCGSEFAVAAAPPAPPAQPFSAAPDDILTAPPKTSAMAIMSLVFGCLFFIFPASIVAIILGHISHSEISKSKGRLKGAGLSLAGLILGYLGVAIIPIILIIAAIAIPNLVRSPMERNETATIHELWRVTSARGRYYARYKHFPLTLESMGPPANGVPVSSEAAGLIDRRVVSGNEYGYVFVYQADDPRRDRFTLTADPVTEGSTGLRHFFVDQDGLVRCELKRPASSESKLIKEVRAP